MLVVKDLDVFHGRIQALRGVDLRVDHGELVTIVGPNGSGKTTLLRALAGLQPARAGTIELDGVAINGTSAEDIVGLGIAMVPEGRELFGPLTVKENLMLGGYAVRRTTGAAGRATDLARVLDLFPALAPRLAQPAAKLSGGEQQMVALGRALMARPRLLLLDEPSVGLAPLVIREIFRALADLKRAGLTILLVEQNARAAFRIADRGYVLEPGGRMTELAPNGNGADGARRAYGLRPTSEESSS